MVAPKSLYIVTGNDVISYLPSATNSANAIGATANFSARTFYFLSYLGYSWQLELQSRFALLHQLVGFFVDFKSGIFLQFLLHLRKWRLR